MFNLAGFTVELVASTKELLTQTCVPVGRRICNQIAGSSILGFLRVTCFNTVTVSPLLSVVMTSLLMRDWARTLIFFTLATARSFSANGTRGAAGAAAAFFALFFLAAAFLSGAFVVVVAEMSAGAVIAGGVAAGALLPGALLPGVVSDGGELVPVCAITLIEHIAAKINPCFIFIIITRKVEILSRVLSMSAICRWAARPV